MIDFLIASIIDEQEILKSKATLNVFRAVTSKIPLKYCTSK